ncbi:hypothetical protein [Amycolatopsis jejuensis]|uniref:hypothetical protein n=1 Tax=Amycolatopsis jejuensis TaxID=330084 RepID=UPI00052535B3|nr:hypothetical protein [Amycolatopsis jejuensis]
MTEDLAAGFRSKLADIERENSERLALIGSRVTKELDAGKEASDKQLRTVGEVIVRVQENARRAQKAGGWVMESTVGDKADGEVNFVFDDEEAGTERAEHPAPEPKGRHRRAAHDDDNFADTDWLAT